MAGRRRWIAIGAVLGFLAVGSNVALMAMSAYLISKAALITNVAEVALAITGGPGPGHRRGRRSATSSATSPTARRSRSWPTCGSGSSPRSSRWRPARLTDRRSGDLLARIVADIETLEDFYVRVIVPPVVAGLVTASARILLGAFDPLLGLALVAFLVGDRGRPAARLAAAVAAPGDGHRRDARRARARCSSTRSAGSPTWSRSTGRPRIANGPRARRRAGPGDGPAGDASGRPRPPWRRSFASLAAVTILAIGVELVGAGRLDGVYLAVLPLVAVACFEVIAPLVPGVRAPGRQRGGRATAVRADRRGAGGRRGAGVPRPDGPPARPTPPAIEIRDLRFRYGPDEPWVLDGLEPDRPVRRQPRDRRAERLGQVDAGQPAAPVLGLRRGRRSGSAAASSARSPSTRSGGCSASSRRTSTCSTRRSATTSPSPTRT